MEIIELPEEQDYWRHHGMEAAYDPATLRIIDSIGTGSFRGIGPGWRCLEVGAGGGSIALALRSRAGAVTVVDRDTRHIDKFRSESFTVLRGDVNAVDLPGENDFIHSRFLLDMVPKPRKTLRRLVDHLRVNGWILVEEFDDVVSHVSIGSRRARNLHQKVLEAKQRVWASRHYDDFVGRGLPDRLADFGLVNVNSECSCRIRRSATPETTNWVNSLRGMKGDLGTAGLSAREYDRYMAQLEAPGFSYFSPMVVRAWAQRVPA